MGIDKIVDTIDSVMRKVRAPFVPISAFILMCSVFRRPGMSPMMLAANVIRRLPEFGGNAGPNADGSSNKMNAFIYVFCQEICNMLQQDCVVESVIPTNSLNLTGTGMSPVGPITFTATNTTPGKATGFPR
jgi:hypothetical protein